MKRRFFLVGCLGVGCLILFGSGCRPFGGTKGLTLSGTMELKEFALGGRVAGRLASVSVEEGEKVKKGQVIATLERFEQTQRDYDRTARLLARGGATEQQREQAQLAMEDQRIVSPVDGIVLTKPHESGEVVAAGTPVVVVGESGRPWVRVYIPEGMISRVLLNQAAILRFDGIRRDFKGHIIFISPQAEFTPRNIQTEEERVTQTFAVKVALDEPQDYLRPGISANVTIELGEETPR